MIIPIGNTCNFVMLSVDAILDKYFAKDESYNEQIERVC